MSVTLTAAIISKIKPPRKYGNHSFLVMWILIFKPGLKRLKCYINDKFSFSRVGDVAFYEPYNRNIPRKQVEIL
jgi:hypothetical protein